MVTSVAIRVGVAKSIQITAEHFQQEYGKKVRAFVYNSKRLHELHELESFSSDAGINVMVIDVQAFAASGADNRRIGWVLRGGGHFSSRLPYLSGSLETA